MQYFQLFFELKGCKGEKAQYNEVPPCSCHLHSHVGHAVFTNKAQENKSWQYSHYTRHGENAST
jgi:hypothetical protein